jgi:hypothetical protein
LALRACCKTATFDLCAPVERLVESVVYSGVELTKAKMRLPEIESRRCRVAGVLPEAKAMPVTTPLVLLETVELLLEPPEVEAPLPLIEPPLPPPLLSDGVGVDEGLLLLVGVGLGLGVTVKRLALVAVLPELVTLIGPLLAPAGTMAVICVSLTTLKNAARPLKLTAVVPVKPLPIRVTLLPTGPEVGVKLDSVGVGVGEGESVLSARIVRASVIVLPAVTALVVVVLVELEELLVELLVPPSPIAVAPWAPARVKLACTVSEIVPLAAVEVR